MRALYTGKFCPFGIHHRGVVLEVLGRPEVDELVIAIGSSQHSHLNPSPEFENLHITFTWQEREAMIRASLKGKTSKKIHTVPVEDIHPIRTPETEPLWFASMMKKIPHCDVLFSNVSSHNRIFADHGFKVMGYSTNYLFCGTSIREKMARGEWWRPFVDPAIVPMLEEMDCESRCERLYNADFEALGQKRFKSLTFEWRTFTHEPPMFPEGTIETIIEARTGGRLSPVADTEVEDLYLLSVVNSGSNLKMKGDKLKIKRLMASSGGMEAWANIHFGFPIEPEMWRRILKETHFRLPAFDGPVYPEDILGAVPPSPNPNAFQLKLRKKRAMRMYRHGPARCGVDYNTFRLNGYDFFSAGLEAPDLESLKETMGFLRLGLMLPQNYLQFLGERTIEKHGPGFWDMLRRKR